MVSPTCSASVLRSINSLSCIVLTSVSGAPVPGHPCSLVSDVARRPAPVVRVSVLLLGIRGVICVPDLSGTRSGASLAVSVGAVWERRTVVGNTKAADPVMSGSRPEVRLRVCLDRWPPRAGANDIDGLVGGGEREAGDRDVSLDRGAEVGDAAAHAGGDGHSGPLVLSLSGRCTDRAGGRLQTHGKDAE